jgi:polyisoprenoid-binding protein YceI
MAALLAAGICNDPVRAATYEIDASHTHIGFSVRHMVVANVKGSFGAYTGSIEFDAENPSELKANATIEVKSIDTANEDRDKHLTGADFFDADTHPTITFTTTRVEGTIPDLTLIGDLTIKGVTKEIALPVEFTGPITDPWGNERIGLSGAASINRQDYGITWSKSLDGGGLVVADTVRLIIEVEGVKKN